jgi:calcineurin-like phosphoesterase family protein
MKEENGMHHPRTFHTSDTHFLHKYVAGLRGFRSADDHDRAIIDAHNRIVRPDDIVYHHGDVGMGREEAILERASELNGRNILLWGNHDPGFACHRRAMRRDRQLAWLNVFESVHMCGQRSLNGRKVLLAHLPYRGDHSAADRFEQWRLRDQGDWLLCGHVHAEWKVYGRQINVGLDVWGFEPVPEGKLATLIDTAEAEIQQIVTEHRARGGCHPSLG